MSSKKRFLPMFALPLIVLLLVGCGGALAEPTATTIHTTDRQTSKPTATAEPPAALKPDPSIATPTSLPPTEIPESTESNDLFDSRIGISVTMVDTSRELTTDYGLPNASEGYFNNNLTWTDPEKADGLLNANEGHTYGQIQRYA